MTHTATYSPEDNKLRFGFAKRPTGWTLLAAQQCEAAPEGVTEPQPTPVGGSPERGHSLNGDLLTLATSIQGRAA